MTSERIPVPTADGDLPVHLWRPQSGSGPGILLLQEIFGISRYIVSRAQDLADLGYVVAAPEIYWRLGVEAIEGPDALQEAFATMGRLDWETAVADAVTALDWLGGREEATGPVGVVGFCFGGGLGFNVAAVAEPHLLVSYYGSSIPDLLPLADQVTAPSLHHFGLADSFIEPEKVVQVRDAVAGDDVEFETYEGADHAFDNPDFHYHHPEASALAWERTVAFLGRHLPVG